MRIAALFLISAMLVMACSGDGRPEDTIETELTTSIVMGAFDPEVGRVGYTIVYVNIDGEVYEMNAAPGAEFIGYDELNSFELNGRRALVAGDLVDGIYMVTYLEVLPEQEQKQEQEPISALALEEKLAEREVLIGELQGLYLQQEQLRESMGDDASAAESEASREATEAALIELEAQITEAQEKIDLVEEELAEAGYWR